MTYDRIEGSYIILANMKNPYKHIASTLKALRQERGWSLDKTAEQTGVSKAMLGQIERQESSPTIATLWKIAAGLDASFSSFIEDKSNEDTTLVHRKGKTQQFNPEDKKIRILPIFPFDKKLGFEIFIIELLPACEHLSPPHQSGVIENIVVAQGEMEVLVNGKWKRLRQGEGLRFEANQAHGYRNRSTKKACFHDIIYYPT